MKDDILNILKNSDKALDVYEIEKLLGITEASKTEELLQYLHELEEEAIIYHTKKDNDFTYEIEVY